MVKINGPLFSVNAQGSISKMLTYSKRKSGQQARKYNKPLTAPSAKQKGQRRLTEFLVAQWQNMTPAQKATWGTNAKASGVNLPAYHYFLREAQRDLYKYHGLCGYWHMNEIVGGKILDLSGNGNHGTLEPSYPNNAPHLVKSRTDRFGNALQFDGVDDYVNCGNNESLSFGSGSFSVELWLKPTSISAGTHTMVQYHVTNYALGYLLNQYGNSLYLYANSDGPILSIENYFLNETGNWIHIVAVFDSDNKEVLGYKNGNYVKKATNKTWSMSADKYTRIGATQFVPIDGTIDEVRVYNRALSAGEIKTSYNFGK